MKKVFRKVLLSLGIVAMAIQFVSAQGGYSYQAIVRSANGEFYADKNVGMRITLSNAGKMFFQELHSVKTGLNGEISIIVGEGDVISGSLSSVPWNTMSVTMMTEICVNGTDFVKLDEKLLEPVPYAMYAASTAPTTTIEAEKDAPDDKPLFSVKDENGNLIFAVYPNLVRVFIDDNATSSKTMKHGFAVSGLKAAKDGGNEDLFVVDESGTKVYVDDADSKTMKHGFAVSGLKATKDGGNEDLFVVDGTGTKVYVDDEDTKTMKHGFAVSGLKATKGGKTDYLTVNASGTQVFVNDADDKTMKHGFAVSGLKATKEDGNENLFVVDDAGTTVYIDEDSKTMKHGFAVSGLKATKEDQSLDYLTVNADGTHVFVGGDGKTMKHGFAVSGLKATKDGTEDDLFVVDNESGTTVYVDGDADDKTMKHGFAVSGLKATKGNDYLSITSEKTEFALNTNTGKSAFSLIDNGLAEPILSIDKDSIYIGRHVKAVGNTEHFVSKMKTVYHIDVKSYAVKSGGYLQGPDWDPWCKAKKIRQPVTFKYVYENPSVSGVLYHDDSTFTTYSDESKVHLSGEDEYVIFMANGEDSIVNFRFNEKNGFFFESMTQFENDFTNVSKLECNLKFDIIPGYEAYDSSYIDCHYVVEKKDNSDMLEAFLKDTLNGKYDDSTGNISCYFKYRSEESNNDGIVKTARVYYYYDASEDKEYFYLPGKFRSSGYSADLYQMVQRRDDAIVVTHYLDSVSVEEPHIRLCNELYSSSHYAKFLSAKSMIERVDSNAYFNSYLPPKELKAYTEYVADSVNNLSVLLFNDYYSGGSGDIYASNNSCQYDYAAGVVKSWYCHGNNSGDEYKVDVEVKNLTYNADRPGWLVDFLNNKYEKIISGDEIHTLKVFGESLWKDPTVN